MLLCRIWKTEEVASIPSGTDKPDYAPGETVTITASGFEAGSTIEFAIADSLEDPGDDGDADVYTPFTVTDGGAGDLDGTVNGEIITTWLVPTDNNGTGSGTPDALNATLNLTATGNGVDDTFGTGDDQVATTTFTDSSHPLIGSNKVGGHEVWEPGTPNSVSKWVPGQPKGYTEGETAAFRVIVEGTEGDLAEIGIELDLYSTFQGTKRYAFTNLESWDTTYEQGTSSNNPGDPTNLTPPPDSSDLTGVLGGVNAAFATIDDVAYIGKFFPTNSSAVNRWEVEFAFATDDTVDSNGDGIFDNDPVTAYIVYGGHIAAPGDIFLDGINATGVVPDGRGASAIQGNFQTQLGTSSGFGKTLVFKGDDIAPVGEPSKTIEKTYVNDDADGSGDVSVGDTITYTYKVTNTGTANLTGVGVLDTPLGAITLSDVAGNNVDFMAPGDVETGTATYMVQASDLGGSIDNTVVASSDQAPNAEDDVSIDVPTPSKTIEKTYVNDDADGSGDVSVGDTITYTYKVTNTGTANLTGVGVLDTPLGAITLSDVAGNNVDFMAPGDVETGTATYMVQASDLGGSIDNTVVASSDQAPNAEDDVSIDVPTPKLAILKQFVDFVDNDGNGEITQGDTLNYKIDVSSTGTANLTDVTVEDLLGGVLTLSDLADNGVDFLEAGDSESATFSYMVTEDDALTGQVFNEAVADSTQTDPVTGDETVPVKFAVDIDIKPGSFPSSFNLRGNGTVPVAIFGTGVFDATEITEVCLEEFLPGPSTGKGCTDDINFEDVDGDGITDAVAKFRKPSLVGVLDTESEFAKLTGTIGDELMFFGIGDVNVTQV